LVLQGFFVTGTDTDVGKTLVCAWLLSHFDANGIDACYWKPVQAGVEPETDSATVSRLSGVPDERIVPEAYLLPDAMAPHEAARRAGITIDMAKFQAPASGRFLVAEGAGGMLVPLTEKSYVIDLASLLHLPVILVARSTLGTINHTLLSLEALHRRKLPVAGVVLNGPATPHNRDAIERYGHTEIIAEIPRIEPVTRQSLLRIEPEIDLLKLARVAA
jgi:dethiobiotin synthase